MKKKVFTALILTALLIVMVPLTALAETTHTHDGAAQTEPDHGSVDIDGGIVASGSGTECKTTGDVTNEFGMGIVASDGATVQAGDVSAGDTGIDASTGAEVYAKTVSSLIAVGISATGGSFVTAETVYATTAGILAVGENTIVNVKGEVCSSTSNPETKGINAQSGASVSAGSIQSEGTGVNAAGANVSVSGSINAGNNGYGILAYNDANVFVKEDVTAGTGIGIDNSASGKGGTVVVMGTVTGSKYGVQVADTSIADYSVSVFEIEAPKGKLFVDWAGKADKTIAENVFYIVKTSGQGDIASMTDKDGKQYELEDVDRNYYLAKAADAGEAYTIKATRIPGYRLSAITSTNAKAILTPGKNGTYTLIIPEGGGIDLNLIYEVVRNTGGGGSSSSDNTPAFTIVGSADAPISNGTWIEINGMFRYMIDTKPMKNATAWITYTAADGQQHTGCFYFDKYGNMRTGWQEINGKQYYFSETPDGTRGMMLVNTTTYDGKTVGADGARV